MDIRRRMLFKKNAISNEGPINTDNYLTIEALENGLTASLSTNACEYCVDGDGNWKSLAAGTATENINSGQTLSFRGELTPNSSNGIGTFSISKRCNLKGNCMSMIFGDNAVDNFSLSGKSHAFYRLFYGCKIVNVSSNFLPATTLASNCYNQMFYRCRSLTIAPELPATILADYCYYSMFSDCTSLTTAPSILPVTTLKYYCYTQMFSNCTSLTTAPELPATTLADYCYNSMFLNCKSLTTAPELPATTLTLSCYYRMFRGCTSLTSAPELYATILVNYCYGYMFYGCSNLNYIKMIATNIPASGCLDNWVNSVASTGTFVKNPAMTTLPTGTSGIPSGWTVVNDGEESGGSSLTFPIKLYEGNNNPNAAEIISYLNNEFGSETTVNYNSHPELFRDNNFIHINDTYHSNSIYIYNDRIAIHQIYNLNSGTTQGDILSCFLYNDGRLEIVWD